jgi:hypothetical protein
VLLRQFAILALNGSKHALFSMEISRGAADLVMITQAKQLLKRLNVVIQTNPYA